MLVPRELCRFSRKAKHAPSGFAYRYAARASRLPGVAGGPFHFPKRKHMARGARCSTRFYSLIEGGVEVREGFTVEEIRMEADSVYGIRSHAKKGSTVTEKSAIVIGAEYARRHRQHHYLNFMKFIILCHPRTGSTLLIKALGDHPAISQGMEIFNPILEGNACYVDWRKEVFIELYGKQDSYTDPIGYLDADRFDLSLLARRFFQDFNGTKIMYDQISLRSKAWHYIQSFEDLRVIILERNLVESAVSFRIAMQTNIWHIENRSSNPPCPRMEYPIEFFGWFYDHFCAAASEFAAMFDDSRVIRVNYRDLVTSWPATMQLIQSHLGVEPLEIPKAYEKRCRERLEDLIVNYHDVRRHYSQHPVLAHHFNTADLMIGINSL